MRLLALLLVLLLAGCSAPSSPSPTTSTPPATTTLPSPTGATTPSTPTATTAATPTPSTPAPPPPPPAGAAFEVAGYNEPAPPREDLISATPTGPWTLRVAGAAGAVPGGARVYASDLGMGRAALGRAAADGSFSLDVTGGEGADVQVATLPEQLPPGERIADQVTGVLHTRGSAYVRAAHAPVTLAAGEREAVATGHSPPDLGWRFAGAVADEGATVRVRGTLRIQSSADLPTVPVHARLARAFDAQGSPTPLMDAFATATRTPAGFPLERMTQGADPTLSDPELCKPVREDASTLRCDVDVRAKAAGLPAGGWAVKLLVPVDGPRAPPNEVVETSARQYVIEDGVPLSILPRGLAAPMRLATLLLVDQLGQTDRGVQADEDAWGWTNAIAWQAPLHVTPRTDATGAPIRYLLDPYLPQVLLTDRDGAAPRLLRPVLPGGSWSVAITDPSGATTTLGPAPFATLVSRTATTAEGGMIDNGGDHVDGVARLATADDGAFLHAFAKDGLHTIRVTGEVRDDQGNAYALSGTYRVLVAEPLDLDLGMLPGTPLETGQYVDRAVQVHPPMPAHVTYRFREWTGPDAALTVDSTTEADASEFGWVHPHAGQPVRPTQPGEYRVDVYANHTDASGRLWAAAWSFGGVVADPTGGVELHGRPGIDLSAQDKTRFERRDTGIPVGGDHLNFPYFAGDVAWETDDDAMKVALTAADPANAFAPLLEAKAQGVTGITLPQSDGPETPGFGQDVVAPRYQSGIGPLFSATASGADVHVGGTLQRTAYAYATVEKPGVRVRESAREDLVPRAYWRFGEDTYALQPGMGPQGDAPNDYKLLFGGAVVRAPDAGASFTGAYSALWIDVPQGDAKGTRVDSPFDPAATPLFRIGGHDVRAFYDPTGTRPGSLLVAGDTADFGGYLVPLGPQRLYLNVTSPSGKVRAFATQANAWGHVHDPALNFVVDEPGVWRVEARVVACPPARDAAWPCLEGGLDEGQPDYVFYVADAGASRLSPPAPAFLPQGGDMALGAAPAEGHATAWMPGWALGSRATTPGGPLVSYHPAQLAQEFPNFEMGGWRDGEPVDQVTFTAVAKGDDGKWHGLAMDAWGARVLAPP